MAHLLFAAGSARRVKDVRLVQLGTYSRMLEKVRIVYSARAL
jgi:hypothetical protein